MATTSSDKVIIADQQDKEILARPPRSYGAMHGDACYAINWL